MFDKDMVGTKIDEQWLNGLCRDVSQTDWNVDCSYPKHRCQLVLVLLLDKLQPKAYYQLVDLCNVPQLFLDLF